MSWQGRAETSLKELNQIPSDMNTITKYPQERMTMKRKLKASDCDLDLDLSLKLKSRSYETKPYLEDDAIGRLQSIVLYSPS